MTTTYTPLDISRLGGGEVINGQFGSKEGEPKGSPITIEQVTGESAISSVVSPFIEILPGQVPITKELQSAGLNKNENISFPETQEIVLPLTDEQTSEWSKGSPEKSKTWLGALSEKIKKAIYFRKVQTA